MALIPSNLKTLYLCRHAKSSWADPGMRDFDRPLNERGLKNAPMMASTFKKRKEPIDLMVSSTAVRALQTAKVFAKELGISEKQIKKEAAIYEASVPTILSVIGLLPAKADRVILFGHNPGFSNVVDHLTGHALGDLPTCGIARLDLMIDDWKLVTKGSAILAWLDHPRKYEQ